MIHHLHPRWRRPRLLLVDGLLPGSPTQAEGQMVDAIPRPDRLEIGGLSSLRHNRFQKGTSIGRSHHLRIRWIRPAEHSDLSVAPFLPANPFLSVVAILPFIDIRA